MANTGEHTHTPRRSVIDAAVAIVFAAFLLFPTFVEATLGRRVEAAALEARLPEPPPRAPRGLDEVQTFARGFDGWYGDRFGGRGTLLRAGVLLSWFTGGPPSPLSARGRDDWTFWDGGGALDAWRGVDPFPDETVEAWQRLCADRQRFANEHGVQMLLVLVPSKAHVYPEYLPGGVERHGPSRLEQVLAALECSGVEVLDLRPGLLAAKSEDRADDTVYYRLGMHWTPRGAQAGVAAIVERLAGTLSGLEPQPPFVPRSSNDQGDSWARRMGLERFVPQQMVNYVSASGWTTERVRHQTNELTWTRSHHGPRGLLLHDSFGASLARPLAESFGELRCVDTYDFDPSLLTEPLPDVVIQLVSEQGLSRFAPHFTPFVEGATASRDALEARFERSSNVLLAVDTRTNRPAVIPVGDADVRAGREHASGGLRVRLDDEAAAIRLPGHDPWVKSGVLRLQFTATRASFLDLLGTREHVLRYDPRRSRRVAVESGFNDVLIELDPELLAGRLVLRPVVNGRQVVFHRIELRGTD